MTDITAEYYGYLDAIMPEMPFWLQDILSLKRITGNNGMEFVRVELKGNGFSGMHHHQKGHIISLPKSEALYITMGPEGGNFDIVDLNTIDGKHIEFRTGTAYHGVFNRGKETVTYYTTDPGETFYSREVNSQALSYLKEDGWI